MFGGSEMSGRVARRCREYWIYRVYFQSHGNQF